MPPKNLSVKWKFAAGTQRTPMISELSRLLASAIFSMTFESSVIAMNARITAEDCYANRVVRNQLRAA